MKLRHFSWLFFIVMLISHAVQAQSFSVGAKGGISIPNLTSSGSNPINSGYSSSLGPDAVLFGEYNMSNLFSLELGLEYSFQGGKKYGKQALPVPAWLAAQYPPGQAPDYLYANFNASAEFKYLLVPLLAKFKGYLNEEGDWSLYIDAGPFVGFLLSAQSITSGTSNVYTDAGETKPILSNPISFDSTTDVKNDLNQTNVGVEGNVGIAYQAGPHRFFVEAGGNYGFIVLQKNAADGKNHAGAAVIRMGYSFQFGKRHGSGF